MRAVFIPKFGGADVLEVREVPDPVPAAGQVRVRVKAAGLNFAEVMARQGLYPDGPKPPCVVGYEVAGEIDALGEGATQHRIGDQVFAMVRFGGHAEMVVCDQLQAVPLPKGMTFEEGAVLPVNYLTAYHMLFRVAGLRPREKVLVHQAAGGVGIAVLQLCKTVEDVEVFGTASAGKHDAIRAQGCTHPIDYTTQDYAAVVQDMTKGKGVDVILDCLGGHDWKKNYGLLRAAGRLIYFGVSNLTTGKGTRNPFHVMGELIHTPLYNPISLMNANKSIGGVNMGHLWGETEMIREEMEALAQLYEAGRIKPHVDAVIPFAQAAAAHRRIEQRKNVGKVVLVP
jgi:NADPH:quinone reductase-like Zn-dependent oxidoreductase